MAIDLSEAKDWIDVVCTGIQTLLGIFGLLFVSYWWDRRKRKEDRKEAKRKTFEATQKADTEKIIAILSDNYDEVQNIFRTLKKYVSDLKRKDIDTGPRTVTEFDVLLYMCHADNWQKFNEPCGPIYRNSNSKTDYGRDKVVSHVREIMKFFKNFSFQLSSIEKACPNNVKLEFSTEVIEMGQTIYPFVTRTRQKLIEKVLIYFGYTEFVQDTNATSQEDNEQLSSACMKCCFPCRRKMSGLGYSVFQNVQGHETQRLTSATQRSSNAVYIEMTGPACSIQQPNERLTTYPGHEQMTRAIPYIESFRYKNGQMTCDIICRFSCIKHLEILIQKGKILQCMREAILKDIKSLWLQSCGTDLPGDLLHSIRMLMFKLSENAKLFQTEQLQQMFSSYVHLAASAGKEVVIFNCERSLGDTERYIRYIREEDHIKQLLEDKRTEVFLQNHAESLRKFITMMLHDGRHQVQAKRCFSSPS